MGQMTPGSPRRIGGGVPPRHGGTAGRDPVRALLEGVGGQVCDAPLGAGGVHAAPGDGGAGAEQAATVASSVWLESPPALGSEARNRSPGRMRAAMEIRTGAGSSSGNVLMASAGSIDTAGDSRN